MDRAREMQHARITNIKARSQHPTSRSSGKRLAHDVTGQVGTPISGAGFIGTQP